MAEQDNQAISVNDDQIDREPADSPAATGGDQVDRDNATTDGKDGEPADTPTTSDEPESGAGYGNHAGQPPLPDKE